MRTEQLIITGKVQGVFYRASAKEKAQALDLRGWVKNRPDGSVEALVSGAENAVEEFADWCRRGPSGARVDDVVRRELPYQFFDDFSVLR